MCSTGWAGSFGLIKSHLYYKNHPPVVKELAIGGQATRVVH
jgi:hypothetical protein